MKTAGYTLVEILVGLTIIGLIFGLGYANFREYSRKQVLSGVVRQMQGDLRLGQERALAGVKPPEAPCDSHPLVGYQFRVDPDNDKYYIEAVCPSGPPKIVTGYVCPSHGSLCGLVENCEDGPSCYTVQSECDALCGTGIAPLADLEAVTVKTGDLPADISIESITSNPIVFKVLGLGTNIPEGDPVQITLAQESTGNTEIVTVTAGGEVK